MHVIQVSEVGAHQIISSTTPTSSKTCICSYQPALTAKRKGIQDTSVRTTKTHTYGITSQQEIPLAKCVVTSTGDSAPHHVATAAFTSAPHAILHNIQRHFTLAQQTATCSFFVTHQQTTNHHTHHSPFINRVLLAETVQAMQPGTPLKPKVDHQTATNGSVTWTQC